MTEPASRNRVRRQIDPLRRWATETPMKRSRRFLAVLIAGASIVAVEPPLSVGYAADWVVDATASLRVRASPTREALIAPLQSVSPTPKIMLVCIRPYALVHEVRRVRLLTPRAAWTAPLSKQFQTDPPAGIPVLL